MSNLQEKLMRLNKKSAGGKATTIKKRDPRNINIMILGQNSRPFDHTLQSWVEFCWMI